MNSMKQLWEKSCRSGVWCVAVLIGMLLLPGCDRSPVLPAGYTIFQNRSEVSLSGGKYNSIAAGPGLAQIGFTGKWIYGEITPIYNRPPSDSDTLGYFLLDTTTEAIEKGLTREALVQKLHDAGEKGELELHEP